MSPQDESSDVDLAELERIWMSHELHDGLLQWIVGAKMQAEALHARSADGSPISTDQLLHVVNLLSRAVVEGRRLLAGLRPPDLDESDWHIALAQWATIARSGSPTHIDLNLDEQTRNIGETQQRCAYRIVQESVGNALRHAEAENVTVEAKFDGDEIVILIIDDGRGFDPANVGPDRYGLKGIRERAALLNGHATIESSEGHGTSIKVRFPRS